MAKSTATAGAPVEEKIATAAVSQTQQIIEPGVDINIALILHLEYGAYVFSHRPTAQYRRFLRQIR